MIHKAVFMDRDGVIIDETGYLTQIHEIRFLPRSIDAIRLLQEDFKIIVVTNQSAVARGYLTEPELRAIHTQLIARCAERGARIDDIYYCPHYPGSADPRYAVDCLCRKPRPGMLLRAATDHQIDLKKSFMIGDSARDIEAGNQAGCRTILISENSPHKSSVFADSALSRPDFIADGLWEAAQIILRLAHDYRRKYQVDETILDRVRQAKDRRVLVVGDIMVDRTFYAQESTSPLRHQRQPGGRVFDVNSTANDVQELGGAAKAAKALLGLLQPILCGVVGNDEEASVVKRRLKDLGAKQYTLVEDKARPTTLKIRVVTRTGRLETEESFRIDREKVEPIDSRTETELFEAIRERLDQIEAILIDDFDKGTITGRVVTKLAASLREPGLEPVLLMVDPKYNMAKYEGLAIDVLCPNEDEANHAVGNSPADNGYEKLPDRTELAQRLVDQYPLCEAFVVKLGHEGCMVVRRRKLDREVADCCHIEEIPILQRVSTVSCGDIFDAYLLAALCGHCSLEEAAELANVAGGLKAEKGPHETVTIAETQEAMQGGRKTEATSLPTVQCERRRKVDQIMRLLEDPIDHARAKSINDLIAVANTPYHQFLLQLQSCLERPGGRIMVYGDSGAGKSTAIEALLKAQGREPILVDCTPDMEPRDKLDSEIAQAIKTGAIFLDEFDKIDADHQIVFGRALRYGIYRPAYGHTLDVSTTVFVLGQRREPTPDVVLPDILTRLTADPLCVPPLRQHKDDIPYLVAFYAQQKCPHQTVKISEAALRQLLLYDYDHPTLANTAGLKEIVVSACELAEANAECVITCRHLKKKLPGLTLPTEEGRLWTLV